MTPRTRRTFPFRRAPIDDKEKQYRSELENVVDFLQREIDLIRNSIDAIQTGNTPEQDQVLESILQQLQALQAALDGFQPLNDNLTAISDLTGSGYLRQIADGIYALALTIPWSDVTGIPSFTEAAWLSRVAFTGRYKDLRGLPNIPQFRQFANVAFTGQFKHLRNKPLLNGDTLYLFENTR